MPKCYKWSQIITASFPLVGIVSVDQESSEQLQNLAFSASKILPTNVPIRFHKAAKENVYKLQADNNPPAEEPSCFSHSN